MTQVQLSRVTDFAALGQRWRALERRAAGSFFQSWTWTGTLAEERFPDPVLVEATEAGQTVALGLFNRRRRPFHLPVLYLGETGDPEYDCPWIEQNGVLTVAGREAELSRLCLGAAARSHEIVISGMGEDSLAVLRRAAGSVVVRRVQDSPFVDLGAVRAAGGDYLAGRSANTRQQIRRSDRFFSALGPYRLERADGVRAELAMLETMEALHQQSWVARAQPGSFARPFFGRFHRALIAGASGRGEVAMLRVSFGETVIGVLYNYIYNRQMLAYQSGFAYSRDVSRAKPGLSCHAGAIGWAMGQDIELYDFLAGWGRYKGSLSTGTRRQVWAEAGPMWSPRLFGRRILLGLRR